MTMVRILNVILVIIVVQPVMDLPTQLVTVKLVLIMQLLVDWIYHIKLLEVERVLVDRDSLKME